MDPLFRWAGSKKKLLSSIKLRFPENYGTYLEPFCGSACLFFDLLPPSAVLSDMNEELMLAYRQIKSSPDEVFECLSKHEVSSSKYYELRAAELRHMSDAERAARFIYLNKLCFNGVYRTNLAGVFNVPMGTKTGKMPTLEVIRNYSQALSNVDLLSGDFAGILGYVKPGDLVYLDPPYSKPEARKRGEYGPGSFHFTDIDRLIYVLEEIDSRGAHFIFSYSDCSVIRDVIQDKWNMQGVSVRRHVAGFSAHRKIVDELIVSNFSNLPEILHG